MESPLVSSLRNNSHHDISALVAKAIHQGVLSHRDHLTLTAALLSNPWLTAADRGHINQVFDGIRLGRVQLAD
ncbi:MAG: hypothetical protein ACFCVD_08795 [Nodosilinea sp.]